MGNYVSCTLSTPSSKAAKVVFPDGEIRQVNTPIKAAELMLESPNFFLVNSQSLKIGRRFSPLNADEDLEPANVYVMFPMKRVNSAATAADMGSLFMTAKRTAKVGILPEAEVMPMVKLEDMEEVSKPEFMHRMSMSRSRKPVLETIVEEPGFAR